MNQCSEAVKNVKRFFGVVFNKIQKLVNECLAPQKYWGENVWQHIRRIVQNAYFLTALGGK